MGVGEVGTEFGRGKRFGCGGSGEGWSKGGGVDGGGEEGGAGEGW